MQAAWAPICRALDGSRFTYVIDIPKKRHIRLIGVRLRSRKEYCGNHPGACNLPDRKHRITPYLEGADWVEFNDLLNQALDDLEMSCRIWSIACVIRIGRRRRTVYDQQRGFGANDDWARYADTSEYVDYCGRDAPPSWFPPDTPGIYRDTHMVVG